MEIEQPSYQANSSSLTSQIKLHLEPNDARNLAALCGMLNEHLRQIEKRLGISIHNRSNEFELRGPKLYCETGASLLTSLYKELGEGVTLNPETLHLRLQEADLELLDTPDGTGGASEQPGRWSDLAMDQEGRRVMDHRRR